MPLSNSAYRVSPSQLFIINDRKKSMGRYFIQKAIKKPNALSLQLGIPVKKNIPNGLLTKIISSKKGDVVVNNSGLGKKRIHVTRLLERRAVLARNLKRFH